ncbi:MAG: zinc ribbon domain-containing protein [Dehalogenimonas sp.]|jgi:putative FmdB family regulatory protein|uniref:Zinc ribbon domain-containing protein n=1 Tax=Candidatus Dehalogenimonas loeffleri TaxID=3127115 RepID=A0ABZ2J5S1_9CHLR|nr:zinc ribbon domain-containing protein [Dehalogenimonas sp.]
MPIYEFRCMDCRKKFDLLRPMSQSTEPAECPVCKGNARRIASTFMAKGSGGQNLGGGGGCSSCSTSSCSSCH